MLEMYGKGEEYLAVGSCSVRRVTRRQQRGLLENADFL